MRGVEQRIERNDLDKKKHPARQTHRPAKWAFGMIGIEFGFRRRAPRATLRWKLI
jgi:hypothetical protein